MTTLPDLTSKILRRQGMTLDYLALLVAGPVALLPFRTFEGGVDPGCEALTSDAFRSALRLTLFITLITVPLNTVFGVLAALVLARHDFRGKRRLSAFIDLPLGISPVVVGLALLIIYNRRDGWFGAWLADRGVQMLFNWPGMVLATVFVALPFVAREVVPVLRVIGTDQELAAQTLGTSGWQTFRMVSLPAIRPGIAFGVVLTTAQALGEYGAVSIASGKLAGKTATLTLHVKERFLAIDLTATYASPLVLAAPALLTLMAMQRLKPREGRSWASRFGILGNSSPTSSPWTTSRSTSRTAR
ncbi:MAG: sulfate ABC transporter permease subunit [Chloroflexota bacterium]|nr:sulfate ABC transporter permease subunit [Chloroflexota bacterium]